MNRQPNLSPIIFRLLNRVIAGKPVSKDVLHIVVKLAGFDRGAVFLIGKQNELKLVVSLGIRNDRKTVELLAKRSGATVSSPVEYEPDTTQLNWFRISHHLKRSLILSYACVAVREKKQYGILYLDSLTSKEPIKESPTICLSRLGRVMLAALLRDQLISLPTVSASDYLASHSIRDLERE